MYVYDKSLNESIALEKISKLQNENKYLKDEMDEESQKFVQTINVLKREIEFYKDNTDILNREIKNLKKTYRRKPFTS
jgi:FtsZ-binding cell division protein ZapB